MYITFISLDLPDSLLGSVWPVIHQSLNVSIDSAGSLAMSVSIGTIVSSLQSYRVVMQFGTGLVTIGSFLLTSIALIVTHFRVLLLY